MKSKLLKISIIASIALSGGLFAFSASAAETSTPTASQPKCELSKALDGLLSVKDSDLKGSEREKQEFDARKNVIEQIVICSSSEIGGYKDRLKNLDLTGNDKRDELLRNKYLGDLDASSFYFQNVSDTVSGDLSLDDIRNLAKDILAWRESFYIPSMSRINDFILVMDDAQAVKTARERFQKISGTLGVVKLSNTKGIGQLLKDSDNAIKKGDELNHKAHNLVWDVDAVFDTSTSTPSSTSSKPLLNENATSSPDKQPQVLPFVKDSLNQIKKAYSNFLAISNIVKQTLGF